MGRDAREHCQGGEGSVRGRRASTWHVGGGSAGGGRGALLGRSFGRSLQGPARRCAQDRGRAHAQAEVGAAPHAALRRHGRGARPRARACQGRDAHQGARERASQLHHADDPRAHRVAPRRRPRPCRRGARAGAVRGAWDGLLPWGLAGRVRAAQVHPFELQAEGRSQQAHRARWQGANNRATLHFGACPRPICHPLPLPRTTHPRGAAPHVTLAPSRRPAAAAMRPGPHVRLWRV